MTSHTLMTSYSWQRDYITRIHQNFHWLPMTHRIQFNFFLLSITRPPSTFLIFWSCSERIWICLFKKSWSVPECAVKALYKNNNEEEKGQYHFLTDEDRLASFHRAEQRFIITLWDFNRLLQQQQHSRVSADHQHSKMSPYLQHHSYSPLPDKPRNLCCPPDTTWYRNRFNNALVTPKTQSKLQTQEINIRDLLQKANEAISIWNNIISHYVSVIPFKRKKIPEIILLFPAALRHWGHKSRAHSRPHK